MGTERLRAVLDTNVFVSVFLKGVKITEALPFLWAVRGDRPPEITELETENE